mmetsp:Transcript_91311/g.133500  ORF Transcript_91311/g.133500 Transcript_91311/m.133500 type:complete len:248 (-) Transcript_91311:1158-1901(-)
MCRFILVGILKKQIFAIEFALQLPHLRVLFSDVGLDTAAVTNFAPRIGEEFFAVLVLDLDLVSAKLAFFGSVGFALNATARRRVIFAYRELDLLPALSQPLQLLHQPLAVRRLAQNNATVMVLNGTRHDFGCTCRAPVYEHHKFGVLLEKWRVKHHFLLPVGNAHGNGVGVICCFKRRPLHDSSPLSHSGFGLGCLVLGRRHHLGGGGGGSGGARIQGVAGANGATACRHDFFALIDEEFRDFDGRR